MKKIIIPFLATTLICQSEEVLTFEEIAVLEIRSYRNPIHPVDAFIRQARESYYKKQYSQASSTFLKAIAAMPKDRIKNLRRNVILRDLKQSTKMEILQELQTQTIPTTNKTLIDRLHYIPEFPYLEQYLHFRNHTLLTPPNRKTKEELNTKIHLAKFTGHFNKKDYHQAKQSLKALTLLNYPEEKLTSLVEKLQKAESSTPL